MQTLITRSPFGHLLNHTGGIHNMTENPEYWPTVFANPERVWNPEDVVTNGRA